MKISLDTLNDLQKTWLTQIPYLNINEDGREKIFECGITITELFFYIDDYSAFFVGNAGLKDDIVEKLSDKALGEDKFVSKLDIVNGLQKCGLGNLKIIDLSELKGSTSSGFQALTFEDSFGNIGIAFRGSDFEFSQGGIRDWLEADMLEYFTGTSSQKKEALRYFQLHKHSFGKTFLYGHSLGGNLASHTLVEYYDEIEQVFIVNGNPINQKLLDTPEKIAAFNNPKKFQCYIICGDIVGQLKSGELYKNNIHYVRNNDTMNKSFVSAHLIQSATYDDWGNFVLVSEEEMEEETGKLANDVLTFIQNVRETLNKTGQKFKNKINDFDIFG